MNESGTTWALVVGIDEYDFPALQRLTGAVADAVAAVGWLRRLGVPDAQIFLHAVPSGASKPALDALAIPYAPASEGEIWKSIRKLKAIASGSRLFVFLCGHGFYAPGAKRLFLTQEASDDGWTNLGIDWYLDLFLSMKFRRQFLFMDGCQNYPYADSAWPSIGAGRPSGQPEYVNPSPDNGMVACFGAAQGQLAAEIDGRGAFMRRLLEGLDPDSVPGTAIEMDFSTGTRTVSLRHVMAQAAKLVARDTSRKTDQRPQLDTRGAAQSEADPLPVYQLPEVALCRFTVNVWPEAARPDVRQLRISFEDDQEPWWRHAWPDPQGSSLPMPLTGCLPQGREVLARCLLRPGAPWDSVAVQPVTLMTDESVTFTLRPRQADDLSQSRERSTGGAVAHRFEDAGLALPPRQYAVKALDGNGRPWWSLHAYNVYERSAQDLELTEALRSGAPVDLGVRFEPHEDGPVFYADAEEPRRPPGGPRPMSRAVEGLLRWAKAVVRHLPPNVSVVAGEFVDRQDHGSRVRVPESLPGVHFELPQGGAARLAGVLDERRTIWIDPIGVPEDIAGDAQPSPHTDQSRKASASTLWQKGGHVSLRQLERDPRILAEPGPSRIRLELPWGSWESTVRVPARGHVRVELPAAVGTPPVRLDLVQYAAAALRGAADPAPSPSPRPFRIVAPVRVGTKPPAGTVAEGLFASARRPLTLGPATDGAAWVLEGLIERAQAAPQASEAKRSTRGRTWLATLEADRRVVFPLLDDHDMGVDLSGDWARVEPLSQVQAPEWDLLVGAGRLDALAPRDAVTLAQRPWADPVLALAAAYVAFAQQAWDDLRMVLGHSIGRTGDSVDVDLLHLALDRRTGQSPTAGAAARLVGAAKMGQVPVFRWGVALALDLLDGDMLAAGPNARALRAWREALRGVERHLSPVSTWTAWTETIPPAE